MAVKGSRKWAPKFGLLLAAWGAFVARLVRRDPAALVSGGVHPSWAHMYLMMLVAQAGFASAYWL